MKKGKASHIPLTRQEKTRNPDKKGEEGDKKQGKGKTHEIVQYVLILSADYALNSA